MHILTGRRARTDVPHTRRAEVGATIHTHAVLWIVGNTVFSQCPLQFNMSRSIIIYHIEYMYC